MVKVEIREAKDVDLPAILSLYAQPDVDDGKVLSIELATGLLESLLYLSWTTLHIWVLRQESLRTWLCTRIGRERESANR